MSTHDAPSEPEPKTPVWLTVLGAFLFLVLAVYLLAPRSVEPDATVRVPAPDDAPAAREPIPPTPTAPPPTAPPPAGDE